MKNMNKRCCRRVLLLLIAVIAVIGLTGCKKQEHAPVPTEAPTAASTAASTAAPTEAPTAAPTAAPTEAPTAVPTEVPTAVPTEAPTAAPTDVPAATSTPMVAGIEEYVSEVEATPAPVTVQTEDFSLTYSGIFAETVACKELTDTAEVDFEFTVTINGTAYTIFKTVVGAENGDIVSVLNGPDGANTLVSFYMNTLPEGLEGDDESAFYIAQDVVNEVMSTLSLL